MKNAKMLNRFCVLLLYLKFEEFRIFLRARKDIERSRVIIVSLR